MEKFKFEEPSIVSLPEIEKNPRINEITTAEENKLGGVLSKFPPRLKKIILAGMVAMTFLACENIVKDTNAEARQPIEINEEEGDGIGVSREKQLQGLEKKKLRLKKEQKEGKMTIEQLRIKLILIDWRKKRLMEKK